MTWSPGTERQKTRVQNRHLVNPRKQGLEIRAHYRHLVNLKDWDLGKLGSRSLEHKKERTKGVNSPQKRARGFAGVIVVGSQADTLQEVNISDIHGDFLSLRGQD